MAGGGAHIGGAASFGGSPLPSVAGFESDVNADINVTPMIDVMLVLLIIFMVVTPALAGYTAILPKAKTAAPEKEKRVTLGIVRAFMGMGESGAGLEAVSGGIAEALIATAIGLVAAIPAVWLYNYFTARLDTLFSELAYAGREMIDWMMTRQAKRELAGGNTPTFHHGD